MKGRYRSHNPRVTRRAASLRLAVAARSGPCYGPFLRRYIRAAHRILKPPLKELSVALVSDRQMSRLHQQFMGVIGPTDVLTFPLDHDAKGRPVAGEVVVCIPEARRRAKLLGVPVERELLLYALHGLLHLCGHDDRTDASFRAMHRAEDQILTQLGVGPVFAPASRASTSALRTGKRTKSGRRRRQAASGGAH